MKQNYHAAMEWFLEAEKQNSSDAQYYIGTMHQEGEGVKVDINMAKSWYQKAADQGDEDSIEALERLNN